MEKNKKQRTMNVYQLTPDYVKSKGYCGGMALVAAPTYEEAVKKYLEEGGNSREIKNGELVISKFSDMHILGLHAEGSTPRVICDRFYIEEE